MKEIYWFRLDCNFLSDEKVQNILFDYGSTGVLVYIETVALLYANAGLLNKQKYKQIAYNCHTKEETVKAVIEDYDLFVLENNDFFSRRVLDELEYKRKISKVRSEAAKMGVSARKSKANSEQMVEQMLNNCSANNNNNNNNTINSIIDNTSSLHSEVCVTTDILSHSQCRQIVELWNNTVREKQSTLPPVRSLSDDRCKKIKIRWKEFAGMGDPYEVMQTVFDKANESKFLQGDNKNGWTASFDWIFQNGKNWAKIYEGNYDNKPIQQTPNINDKWN